MAIEDINILKNNCEEYAQTAGKSVEILKNANGKNHYTKIAKIVGIHQTTVSGLLKKAERLGLAKRTQLGVYKKTAGILSYMPPKSKVRKKSTKTVSAIIKKLTRNKKAKIKSSISPDFLILNRIEANMLKMAKAYQHLYAVENSLRELIRKVLISKVDWWKNYIPSSIQKVVEDTIKKTPYDALKRKDQLEYTHLGQLKEIIINKKNWNDFLPYLNEKDKSSFAVTIDKAIPSRNAIGHCIPLKSKDLKVVDVRFEDILKMIK